MTNFRTELPAIGSVSTTAMFALVAVAGFGYFAYEVAAAMEVCSDLISCTIQQVQLTR